jgi:HD-like signal output (HDOD) protein
LFYFTCQQIRPIAVDHVAKAAVGLREKSGIHNVGFILILKIFQYPLAVQRLITEINKDDPDLDELAKLISSATGIAAKVIKTVNSSYYSPRSPVTQIKQAAMFLIGY